MSERDVTQMVVEEMQRGSTTLNLMREKLSTHLTAEGFSKWETLVKQLIDQYGGQVQQLLRRITEQDREFRELLLAQSSNEDKLSRFAQIASAIAERINAMLEAAATWDTPPRTYALARGVEPPPDAAAESIAALVASNANNNGDDGDGAVQGELHIDEDQESFSASDSSGPQRHGGHSSARDRLGTLLEEEATLEEEAEC